MENILIQWKNWIFVCSSCLQYAVLAFQTSYLMQGLSMIAFLVKVRNFLIFMFNVLRGDTYR